MSELAQLLSFPNIPDAALICKNLARRTIRRSDAWNHANLEQQNSDELVTSANEEARSTGATIWAMQLTRDPYEEADPIVFRSYYQREIERRLRRMCIDESKTLKTTNTTATTRENDSFYDAKDEKPKKNSDATMTNAIDSKSALRSHLILSQHLPNTRYPPDSLIRWIHS